MISNFSLFVGVLPWGLRRKRICLQCRRLGFNPWVRKIWRITLFLPGESHGLRNLVGYRPQGFKESNTTEHFHINWVKGSKDIENVYRPSKILTSHNPPSTILNIRLLFYLDKVDLVWTDGQLEGNHKDLDLVVLWLRLHTPNTGAWGSIPGQGTRSHTLQQLKILHATMIGTAK